MRCRNTCTWLGHRHHDTTDHVTGKLLLTQCVQSKRWNSPLDSLFNALIIETPQKRKSSDFCEFKKKYAHYYFKQRLLFTGSDTCNWEGSLLQFIVLQSTTGRSGGCYKPISLLKYKQRSCPHWFSGFVLSQLLPGNEDTPTSLENEILDISTFAMW